MRQIIVYTFIFGLIAHGYCFFNSDFSHDSLMQVCQMSPYEGIASGRYLRPLYKLIFGKFAMPALTGFIELFFTGIAIYFLIDVIGIHKKRNVIIACGIMVTNASVALLNATYIHDAGVYALSLMLTSLGVWVTVKSKKGIWYACIFYFLSMGLYQAYISVAVLVVLIVTAMEIIDGSEWKKAWNKMTKRLLSIIASIVLYFACYLVVLKVTGVEAASGYNSVSQAYDVSLSSICERLSTLVYAAGEWFILPAGTMGYLAFALNVTCLLLTAFLIVRIAKANSMKRDNVIILVVTFLMMPVGMNVITLLSNMYHDLTIYSFYLCYVLVIVLIEKAEEHYDFQYKKIATRGIVIILMIMIAENCVYSNEAYLKKSLEHDATLSLMTRVVDRIEQTDGYQVGQTKIAIVGELNKSQVIQTREGVPEGTGLWDAYAITYYSTYERYVEYVLGYNVRMVTEEKKEEMAGMTDVQNMGCFPAKDSVKMIDNVLVVKFTEK